MVLKIILLVGRIAGSTELIPLYNSEQFLLIGTDNDIEIEGKVYNFSETDYSKYELKNDIIFDVTSTSSSISGSYKLLTDGEYNALNKNNYELLYYDKTGGKYYHIARSSDTATKINITENGVTYKLAVKYLNAEKIIDDPATYYGCYVNYQAENSDVVGWRIFYAGAAEKIVVEEASDTNKIYLIADDYIPLTNVPNAGNGSSIVRKTTDYCFSMENVINDYSGSEWILQNSLAKNWLAMFFKYQAETGIPFPNKTSNNNNIKAVAYMMDTNIWNRFKGDRAYYAIGGAPLELFVDSYNAKNSTSLTVNGNSLNGYDTVSINANDSLYAKNSVGKTSAMWLASPSSADSNNILYINSTVTGNLPNEKYDDTNNIGIGFRPIICLKDDVELSRNQDGTYNVK